MEVRRPLLPVLELFKAQRMAPGSSSWFNRKGEDARLSTPSKQSKSVFQPWKDQKQQKVKEIALACPRVSKAFYLIQKQRKARAAFPCSSKQNEMRPSFLQVHRQRKARLCLCQLGGKGGQLLPVFEFSKQREGSLDLFPSWETQRLPFGVAAEGRDAEPSPLGVVTEEMMHSALRIQSQRKVTGLVCCVQGAVARLLLLPGSSLAWKNEGRPSFCRFINRGKCAPCLWASKREGMEAAFDYLQIFTGKGMAPRFCI